MSMQQSRSKFTLSNIPFKCTVQSALGVLVLCTSLSAAANNPCILGDGYRVSSGSAVTIFPVNCPSDCRDYPNGTIPTPLFCVNGVLGESDPRLTGGSVAPVVNALQYNGFSCTAIPNPYSTPQYIQSADRKGCVKVTK
jgi:hypothetical protein